MMNYFIWTLFLVIPEVLVVPLPSNDQRVDLTSELQERIPGPENEHNHQSIQSEKIISNKTGEVISVRITSSVAVDRGKGRQRIRPFSRNEKVTIPNDTAPETSTKTFEETSKIPTSESISTNHDVVTEAILHLKLDTNLTTDDNESSDVSLLGANLEYIKQLNSKKLKNNNMVSTNPLYSNSEIENINETDDAIAESSVNSFIEIAKDDIELEIPIGRSVPASRSSENYIQDPPEKSPNEQKNISDTNSSSYNVVHDNSNLNSNPSHSDVNLQKFYDSLPKVYSEPAQIYSEPAKIYSEPAKIYSEPAKIYSEPAKIYSEPAKFYSQPASLFLPPEQPPWQHQELTVVSTTATAPLTGKTDNISKDTPKSENENHEMNYEIDEKLSVLSDGNTYGVQDTNTDNCKHDNCKVGYVVEGRQYRKYRVEERTSDGFIVGEYGVVRQVDGALRGVRYTADSEASPRLIQDALMKFLQLR